MIGAGAIHVLLSHVNFSEKWRGMLLTFAIRPLFFGQCSTTAMAALFFSLTTIGKESAMLEVMEKGDPLKLAADWTMNNEAT